MSDQAHLWCKSTKWYGLWYRKLSASHCGGASGVMTRDRRLAAPAAPDRGTKGIDAASDRGWERWLAPANRTRPPLSRRKAGTGTKGKGEVWSVRAEGPRCACNQRRRQCLYSLSLLGDRIPPLSAKESSSPSRSDFSGQRGSPSRPHSSGGGTLESPACYASPCRARARCVRRPPAGPGMSVAPSPPGRGADG
jgi:hypothetical protein